MDNFRTFGDGNLGPSTSTLVRDILDGPQVGDSNDSVTFDWIISGSSSITDGFDPPSTVVDPLSPQAGAGDDNSSQRSDQGFGSVTTSLDDRSVTESNGIVEGLLHDVPHTTFSSVDLRVLRSYAVAPIRLLSTNTSSDGPLTMSHSSALGEWKSMQQLHEESHSGRQTPGCPVATTKAHTFDAAIAQLNNLSCSALFPLHERSEDVTGQAVGRDAQRADTPVLGAIFDTYSAVPFIGVRDPEGDSDELADEQNAQPEAAQHPKDVVPPTTEGEARDNEVTSDWTTGWRIQNLFALAAGALGAAVVNRRLEPNDSDTAI